MTSNRYLAIVEAIIGAELPPRDAEWMHHARLGGEDPRRFAYWLSLTNSPPPSAARSPEQDGATLPVRPPLRIPTPGRQGTYEMEDAQ